MKNTLLSIRKLSATLFITLLLILGNTFAQEQSTEQKVNEDEPIFDRIPQWYIDQKQDAVKSPSVVYTDAGGYDNFYLGVDFAESHISVNPTDPTEFFTAYNVDESHRTSDGHDWVDGTAVPWGATIQGDVLTAYDSDGRLYYENMYGYPNILGCKIMKSFTNGSTWAWSSAITAIDGVDKNWLACDQTDGPYSNYVYTVMTTWDGTNAGGAFSRSTNWGSSWTETFSPTTQELPGMMVCVGAYGSTDGGAVYVVTNSGLPYASTYTFYLSTNGGTTFSNRGAQSFSGHVGDWNTTSERNSVEGMRVRPYPYIAADNSNGPYRGRLYLVYTSNYPAAAGNKPNIYCRYSSNYGLTWSSAVRVNDDSWTENNNFHPAMWCDLETGRLYVQWMDTRDDGSNGSAYIYASYSDNGGVSFAPNQKISNDYMTINCPTCGGTGTPRYQGDYNSIVSNGDVSMLAWSDFRWGSFASFTGYFPDYAMKLSGPTKGTDGASIVEAEVPSVKLYTDDVIFTATIETPTSGNFYINFPYGNTLSTFPGSVPIEITDANVPAGSYTLTVIGTGPNGTPIHEREIEIPVTAGGPNTWIGAFNSYWHNASNWSAGHIPLAGEDVLITSAGNNPVKVDIFDEACTNLTINTGAHLDIYDKSLTVTGSLDNNGTIKFLDPSADLTAANFSNIGGTIQMNNGTFTVAELTDSGVVGTWDIDDGNIVLNQTSGYPDLLGTIIMSGGNMLINDASSSSIWGYGGSPASVTMSGGILDFNCSGMTIGSSYPISENITGGVIRTSGSLNISNTSFTPLNGTIELYGSSDAIISHTGGSIYNIDINKDGSKTENILPEIWEDREGNMINSPKSNSSYPNTDLTVSNNLIISSGLFHLNGQTVNVNGDIDVYGTFEMNNAADIMNAGNSSWDFFRFYSGSTGIFSNGVLNMVYALWFDIGSTVGSTAPNVMNFNNTSGLSAIVGYQPATLANVNYLGQSGNGNLEYCADLTIDNFYVAGGAHAINYGGNVTINNYSDDPLSEFTHTGSADKSSGQDMIVTETDSDVLLTKAIPTTHFVSDVMIDGTFDIGTAVVTSDGKFESSSTGEIIVSGGSLTCGHNAASGWNILGGQTTLSSGSIEFPGANLQIHNSTISGGTLIAGRSIAAPPANALDPTGGVVELVGSGSGHYIQVNSSMGNFFHDLTVNRTATIGTNSVTPIRINGNMLINSGGINGNNNTIEVAGTWTNNVGTSGFVEGTSRVKLISPTIGVQMINSTEHFNILENASVGGFRPAAGTDVSCNIYDYTSGGISTSGSTFTAFDLEDSGIYDNLYAHPNSSITLHQTSGYVDLFSSVIWVKNNASINIIGGGDESYWCNSTDLELLIEGTGVLDFDGPGITIWDYYALTDNITDGTIKTSGWFTCNRTDFNPSAGTFEFYGGNDAEISLQAGSSFHNLLMNKSGGDKSVITLTDRDGKSSNSSKSNTASFLSDIVVANNFDITDGTSNTLSANLYVGGNWSNTVGTAAFIEGTNTVFFEGPNDGDILTEETFYNLTVNKSNANFTALEAFANVNVLNLMYIFDGVYEMNPGANLILGNDVIIGAGAGLNANDAALNIYVGGNWTNYNTDYSIYNGFWHGYISTVIFNTGSDNIITTSAPQEDFYNLTVYKASGQFRSNDNIQVFGNLLLFEGEWNDNVSGLTHTFHGDFEVTSNAAWYTHVSPNTVIFAGENDQDFTYNHYGVGYFKDVVVNKSPVDIAINNGPDQPETKIAEKNSPKAQTLTMYTNMDIQLGGTLTINDGTLEVNGNTLRGDGNITINTGGTLSLNSNSTLWVDDGAELSINGGLLETIGTPGNLASITHRNTGYYAFEVEGGGTISAEYTKFEYMNANGVWLKGDGFADPVHAFNYCTFLNGVAGYAPLLVFNNSQVLTCTGANFPQTGVSDYNVAKAFNEGEVTMVEATGSFAGEDYEFDTYNRVYWTYLDRSLDITMFIEGPFNSTTNNMSVGINSILPTEQPFDTPPLSNPNPDWYYTGTESVAAIPNAFIVDWVLVQLRDAASPVSATPGTTIYTQAAFITNTGQIVDLDGVSPLAFSGTISNNLYAAVWTRNHLGIISANPLAEAGGVYSYDFSTSSGQAFGGTDAQKMLSSSPVVWGTIAGDANGTGLVAIGDKTNVWIYQAGEHGYLESDYNFDGEIDHQDKNDFWLPNMGEGSQIPE